MLKNIQAASLLLKNFKTVRQNIKKKRPLLLKLVILEKQKRKETGITGTTFHFGIKSKPQPHKSTTLLKPQEDLTRDSSLQNGYAESDHILPLVEKLEAFVDLQHKQYETLKCSVRQMNVHLHHQTRTLVKINTSIQKQTSAINRLAFAQHSSAANIETLAANVLQTNASLVEGNAALNKTLQGALDMLQVGIKTHCQQQSSATANNSITTSTHVRPTQTDISSPQRFRRLRRSLSGEPKIEESSTRKKLKKRMRSSRVEIIPV